MSAVRQRENERNRRTVEGTRTDGAPCTLLVIHQVSGTWVRTPTGADQFGGRVTRAQAATVARAILGGVK